MSSLRQSPGPAILPGAVCRQGGVSAQVWAGRPTGMLTECHPWGRYSEINAVSTACSYGVPECEKLAATLFAQWKKNPQNNP